MHPSKQEFNDLRDELKLSLTEIADLIGVSHSAARKYAAARDPRVPAESTLVIMRREAKLRRMSDNERASYEENELVERVRAMGYRVEKIEQPEA